ncbi:MAG: peptidoglycan-binding protein [Bacteroidetes bacterium]|nr:MAG: peptidoglycan-binding protein [Bacteroidota bacterium]
MIFGERELRRGDAGKDVTELQLRLAGFMGTVWDGDFGPLTEQQVTSFQRDVMELTDPSGVVDQATYAAMDAFAARFPIPFDGNLGCTVCPHGGGGNCPGERFGQGRFAGVFHNPDHGERSHQHEYPGMHKAVLHTFRAFAFYAEKAGLPAPVITSGYRCHINNILKGRRSTNHMGKALDFSFSTAGTNRDLRDLCQEARQLLMDKSFCQVRWDNPNQKALEPGVQERPGEFTAPTWVHLDVREYDRDRYLADTFFVRTPEALDKKDL